jgi:hypothetical protein
VNRLQPAGYFRMPSDAPDEATVGAEGRCSSVTRAVT